MSYDQFIAEWNNKQVTKFGGECVALIAEYEAENNLPIVYGDASAWVNNPTMATAYEWIQNNPNNAAQIPDRGQIIVWSGDLPYTNHAGHIAFFDSPIDQNNFMSFGQNSGGPTAHFQSHSWAYVAGWYVPKSAPVPALPPVPVVESTPVAPAPVYTPPAPPVNVPYGNTVTIDYDYRGYNTATGAGNYDATQLKQTVPKGTYTLIKTYPNRTDLANIKNADGSVYCWINLGEVTIIEDEIATQAAQAQADATAQAAKEAQDAQTAAEAQAKAEADAAQKLADEKAAQQAAVIAGRSPVTPTTQVTVPVLTDTTASVIASYKAWDKPRNYYLTADYDVQDVLFTHPAVELKEGQKIGFSGSFVKDDTVYYRPMEDKPLTDNAYGVPVSIFEGAKDGAPWLESASLYDTRVTAEEKAQITKVNHQKYKNTGFDSKEELYAIWTHIEHLTKNNKFFDIIFVPFRKKKGK